MKFHDLKLSEPILRALAGEGYITPTPIQEMAIPHVLAGKDLLGCAQTGTGKTAAFALPIIHRLTHPAEAPASASPTGAVHTETAARPHADTHAAHPSRPQPRHAHPRAHGHSAAHRLRVLVLTPTRELAAQISESFGTYGRHAGLRHTVVYGGVGQGPQVSALRAGVDILIATPGRLLDLMNQGHVDLSHIETFVLDEGDNMLDMGFIHDIRRIVPELPARRQTLMFSATMPPEIRKLANTILRDPVNVEVTPVASAAETVDQAVFFVDRPNKPMLLLHLLKEIGFTRVLVFTRTKRGADKVAKFLVQRGIKAQALHGNKTQGARDRAMSSFKSHAPPVLVATDIAARGLDVDQISHVINFEVPNVPETYVHRIGRTGRAGAAGSAVSLCDREERPYVRAIEKLMRKNIPVRTDHPELTATRMEEASDDRRDGQRGGGERGQSSYGHRDRPQTDRPQRTRPLDAERSGQIGRGIVPLGGTAQRPQATHASHRPAGAPSHRPHAQHPSHGPAAAASHRPHESHPSHKPAGDRRMPASPAARPMSHERSAGGPAAHHPRSHETTSPGRGAGGAEHRTHHPRAHDASSPGRGAGTQYRTHAPRPQAAAGARRRTGPQGRTGPVPAPGGSHAGPAQHPARPHGPASNAHAPRKQHRKGQRRPNGGMIQRGNPYAQHR